MSISLNIDEIQDQLPHRFPMLLVDRLLEIEPGKRAVGLKNVSINEPFFPGHFPAQAVMPGVLIVESMAQVSCLMMLFSPEIAGKIPLIGEIENARFYRPVVPGDTLITEATVIWVRGMMGKVSVVARVEGVIVAKCDLKFAFKEPRSVDLINPARFRNQKAEDSSVPEKNPEGVSNG